MAIKIKKILFITLVLCITSKFMIGCGTLGGIGDNIYFGTSKKKLEIAIDSLYTKHPEYKILPEWEIYNHWSASGYDFLESRIFYFSNPDEMYYITFVGDSTLMTDTSKISIAIRAINRGKYKWQLDADLESKEKERIEKRFDDEIISKLKEYTKVRTWKESHW